MDARRKSQLLTSWILRALLRLSGPPTRTDTDCAFHVCFAILCIPYVRSYFISIVSLIDCGLRFYAFKKVRFLGCSCPSLAP